MIELKIGRHTYVITELDRFTDNGSCVQLTTQSKERSHWGFRLDPVLSKRAIKELKVFDRHEISSAGRLVIFSLIKRKGG